MTETAAIPHDLFISYAEADRAWVDGFLIDALDQAGATYQSEDAFALGVPRLVEFERAIKQSTRTLLILSPAYLADTFGQFVDVLVNSYGMETATWPVIPLLLQPVDQLPPRLSQLVRLDATTAAGQQATLAKLCAELKRPLPSPAPLPACPYPGMVPFDESDSARFFGREPEVAELVERLRLHPFLAVIGASGSGKSSLVRAGLLPALRKSRLFGGDWLIRTMRPGEAPLDALATALGIAVPGSPVGPSKPSVTDSDDLLSALLMDVNANPLATNNTGQATNGQTVVPTDVAEDSFLTDPAAIVAKLVDGESGARLLLVVDQYEETFTVAGKDAAAFQQALVRLAATLGCYVVLTARADFYADLMLSPLWEQIQAHRAEVTPLSDAGLRRAIVRPAEQAGVAIEAALVERLLADAAGEPGVLPLVQETLVLLWEKLERRFLPMRAYTALVLTRDSYGTPDAAAPTGLQVAIARRADATLTSLTDAQQPIARRIFLRLIQFGEGRADTRRQQPETALQSAGDDPRAFAQTLQALAASRLLTLSGTATKDERPTTNDQSSIAGAALPSSFVLRPSSVRVDIAHEALIRGWPTLQGWLKERREGELTRRRLEGKAQEWVRLGRAHGGLLDEIEVLEAERWLASDDAAEMGFAEALPELVVWSRAELEAEEQQREAARQRELAQAQALAEEQQQRAEEQAAASRLLRARNRWLIGVAGAAAAAAVAALLFWSSAYTQKINAQKSASTAQTAKAQALSNEKTAVAAQAQAEAQSARARAGELAAQSELAREQYPQRSLLLAVEAISMTMTSGDLNTHASEQALRNALGYTNWRLLDDQVVPKFGAAVSDDGRFLAVSRRDGTIALRHISAADPTTTTLIIKGLEYGSSHLALSRAGTLLAGVFGTDVLIWDLSIDPPAATARPAVTIPTTYMVMDLQFSPRGRWLAISTANQLFLWDLQAEDLAAGAHSIDNGGLGSPSFSPDERTLAVPGKDNNVNLYDLSADLSGAALASLPDAQAPVLFDPQGRWLATGGISGTMRLWDLAPHEASVAPHVLAGAPSRTNTLAFSPDGRWLIAVGAGMTAWDTHAAESEIQPQQLGNKNDVWSIRFGQDSHTLLSAGEDRAIRLWDLALSNPAAGERTLPASEKPPATIGISSDGLTALTYNPTGSLQAWSLESFRPTLSSRAANAKLSSDGRWALLGMSAQEPFILDLSADKPTSSAIPADLKAADGIFSADGRRLAVRSGEDIGVWDLDAKPPMFHKLPSTPLSAAAPAVLCAFSADGTKVVIIDDANALVLWDVRTDPPTSQTLAHVEQKGFPTAISHDGHWLAGVALGKVLLWDLRANPPIMHMIAGQFTYSAVAISSSGRYFATKTSGGEGMTVLVLDSAGELVHEFNLHGDLENISALVFSPDEATLLSVSASSTFQGGVTNKTIRLWAMRDSGDAPQPLSLGAFDGGQAAFNVDGSTIIGVDSRGYVQRWAVNLGELIHPACAIVGRNLTWDEWRQYFPGQGYRQICPQLPPHWSYIDHLLDQADTQARQGEIATAITAYTAAQQLSPQYVVNPRHWNALCRAGTLRGYVKDVLEACGRVVTLTHGTGAYHDSRGLARALTGDTAGAIEDFEIYIAWARAQANADTLKEQIVQREQWIADLKASKAFDQAMLEKLREQEQ